MVVLGVIGLVMPLMPGTIFLIVAVACVLRARRRGSRHGCWIIRHLANRCGIGAPPEPSRGRPRPWLAWE
ncbi:DUF454 family protein [Bradyrhizobium sp. AZCC 1614]|uniref:DUF454 family protein n=1 Tax=Bradyrhizobium sp. AZCC 1614 TaxID=3117017 RepID=UPI002FF33E10